MQFSNSIVSHTLDACLQNEIRMLSIFRRMMVGLSPIDLPLLLAVILVISVVNVAGYVRDHKED